MPPSLEGWMLDPKYYDKLQEKGNYTFLNAWIYFPEKNKAATCHYNLGNQGGNKLSLVIEGKNTDHIHFANDKFAHLGTNGDGIHCSNKGGAITREDCVFADGPTPRELKSAK